MNAKDKQPLDRVKQVVQLCVEQDLYVLINIHWDGGWLENNVTVSKQQENMAKQTAFWQQIASHLRDFDQHVLFASANEPHVETEQQMEVLLSYHQAFIDAVRSTGGKNAYRVLVVQGPKTDIELTNQLFLQMPSDTQVNRIMAEVHFYSPYNFTLMQTPEDWGNPFYYWGSENHASDDIAHNPTWGEEAHVKEMFDLMRTQFVDLGIPVILGEFSAMRRTQLTGENLSLHQASRNYYHQFIVEQALKYGLIPFYWDNGSTDNFNSAIFDRSTNQVFDQMTLDALLQGTVQN